jgi:hypothetical protein
VNALSVEPVVASVDFGSTDDASVEDDWGCEPPLDARCVFALCFDD